MVGIDSGTDVVESHRVKKMSATNDIPDVKVDILKLTSKERRDAEIYAISRLAKENFENFTTFFSHPKKQSSRSVDLGYLEWNENDSVDYRCPEKLKDRCVRGRIKFTKKGCEAISCYPRDNDAWCDTDKLDDDRKSTNFHRWDVKTKRCVNMRREMKDWATFPESRRVESVPGITDAPPFEWDTDKDPFIRVTKPYCENYMRVSYDPVKPDCYEGTGQKILEFFTGALDRELAIQAETVVNKISELPEWLGLKGSKKKSSNN